MPSQIHFADSVCLTAVHHGKDSWYGCVFGLVTLDACGHHMDGVPRALIYSFSILSYIEYSLERISCVLTFFKEPAASEPIYLFLFKKDDWGDKVIIVVHLGISCKNFISFLLQYQKLLRWINRLFFSLLHHDGWVVLVRPWASIRFTIFVIFTL